MSLDGECSGVLDWIQGQEPKIAADKDPMGGREQPTRVCSMVVPGEPES